MDSRLPWRPPGGRREKASGDERFNWTAASPLLSPEAKKRGPEGSEALGGRRGNIFGVGKI